MSGVLRIIPFTSGHHFRNVGRLGASLALLGLALCVGCSTLRVTTDFDPGVEFGGFGRYAWLPDGPAQGKDPRLHNDLIDARVRGAVDRVLAERGTTWASRSEERRVGKELSSRVDLGGRRIIKKTAPGCVSTSEARC
jgi:hypothetical protein